MHATHVLVEILLPLARVAALRTSDGLVVAMNQHMPLQCAPVRELRPTCLAHMGISSVLLPHMQVESASGFKLTSTIVANDCPHIRVDKNISL